MPCGPWARTSRRSKWRRATACCRAICASASGSPGRPSRCRVRPEVRKKMYRYDDFDEALVNQRVSEFRDQVGRRLSGALTEDEFKILRLMNGVYLQLHAYMLRIAIPYGTLSSEQMRMLAHVARRYDQI